MLGNISLVWGVTIAYFIARAVLPDEDDSEKLWAFALSVRDARMPQWPRHAHVYMLPNRPAAPPSPRRPGRQLLSPARSPPPPPSLASTALAT